MPLGNHEEMCSECNERPVQVKKHGLCKRCYQQLRLRDGMRYGFQSDKGYIRGSATVDIIANKDSELEFIVNYFNHDAWVHQPCTFSLSNTLSYRPDFYDAIQNVFIEVAGSHQAYYHNKSKYELFRKRYPKLKFEIRKPSGEILNIDANGKLHW